MSTVLTQELEELLKSFVEVCREYQGVLLQTEEFKLGQRLPRAKPAADHVYLYADLTNLVGIKKKQLEIAKKELEQHKAAHGIPGRRFKIGEWPSKRLKTERWKKPSGNFNALSPLT